MDTVRRSWILKSQVRLHLNNSCPLILFTVLWIEKSELRSSLHYSRATLFQRHAALLVANNAVCLMSGFDFEVEVIRVEITHNTVAV